MCVVDRGVEVGLLRDAAAPQLAAELLGLALEHLAAAEAVDRAVLGGGHEPGARVVRDARLGPLLERRDQRVLGEVLGEADVAHDGQPGDQPGRLDPPDRLDRAMRSRRRSRPATTLWFCSACVAQCAPACSRSSGVNSSPKSSASNTWRISISARSSIGFGQRLTHSIASSSDLTWNSQKPAISSLVSANGPSMTVRSLPLEAHARALRARLEALAREHHAGLDQLLVVLAHRGEQLLAGHLAGLAVLVRLDHHHETHIGVPPGRCLCLHVERLRAKSTRRARNSGLADPANHPYVGPMRKLLLAGAALPLVLLLSGCFPAIVPGGPTSATQENVIGAIPVSGSVCTGELVRPGMWAARGRD